MKVTTKDGLLWDGDRIIGLPEADLIAFGYGLYCAEQLVKALEQNPNFIKEYEEQHNHGM